MKAMLVLVMGLCSVGTVFGQLLAEHLTGRLAASDLPLPFTDVTRPGLRAGLEAVIELGAQVAHFAGHRHLV